MIKFILKMPKKQIIAMVVAGVTLLSFLLSQLIPSGPKESWTGVGSGEVVIEIPAGVNLTEIGRILAAAGVVESASFFAIATYGREEAKSIQPGRYLMALKMGSDEAIDRLLDPKSKQELVIAVPEGLRKSDTIKIVANKLNLKLSEVETSINNLENGELELKLPNYANNSAEGFLYPATYSFPDNVSVDEVFIAMVERFLDAESKVDLVKSSKAIGFTPLEVLTMASLVEAEAFPIDFGKVARTIRNRLEVNMPLQFDSTVNFALGTKKLLFTKTEFAIDSPYNTYKYQGLPPGPIGSPGEAALAAVLNPPEGNWLYFVSTNPDQGITKFTNDYQEFLKYKREFQAWYRENR